MTNSFFTTLKYVPRLTRTDVVFTAKIKAFNRCASWYTFIFAELFPIRMYGKSLADH